MKILILIGNGFEDSEFLYPYYRFREEGYDVDVTGITISNLGVVIDEATMELPEELGIGSVSVTGISLLHEDDTWSIDFDKISIQDIDPFPFLGCEFTISEISFSSEWVLTFAGTVKLPTEGLPDAIAGKTLTITKFQILPGPVHSSNSISQGAAFCFHSRRA